MGLRLIFRDDTDFGKKKIQEPSCKCKACKALASGNPDPKNFKVLKVCQINKHLVVKVNYPNCTNFGGDKILVFLNRTDKSIIMAKELDPHFADDENSPFARFKPTNKGWLAAILMAKSVE